MQLTRIRVQNLRCIADSEVKIRDFTSLIGPNNCGKSSFIRGVELLLNQSTPSADEWRRGSEDQPLIVEGDFDSLAEWEANAPGVAGVVHEGKIRLRVVALRDEAGEKVTTVYEAFLPRIEIAGFSETWGQVDEAIKAVAAEFEIKGPQWKNSANRDKVRQRVMETMKERVTIGPADWTADNISIKQALQQAIPQAYVVPAVRDASEDAKPGAKTSFGLLLSRIILPALQESDAYLELLAAVEKIRKRLGSDDDDQLAQVKQLASSISERLSGMIDAKVRLSMEAPDAGKFVGTSTTLRLDDGTDTRIALQGHGLQRSLVFALIEVLANQEAARGQPGAGDAPRIRATVLLFEEPELFFHPHVMRRLKRALRRLADSAGWQVIVSTHSPFLIDVGEDPLSLAIFKRANATTAPTVKQLTEDPFAEAGAAGDREALQATLSFHPSVCEAFFASRTILVEGASELAVLVHQPKLYELAEVNEQARASCTVVSCAGKWTIAPMAHLLRKFEVPFRVIHDCDRKGRNNAALAECAPIDPFRANARIAQFVDAANLLVIDDTLEHVLWNAPYPNITSDKPYRAWKRVGELCADVENLDHVPQLRNMVRFAFCW